MRKVLITEDQFRALTQQPMNILVACEESQTVCSAFRERGHNAYSCDIQDSSGGQPEWHIKGDAVKALDAGELTLENGDTVYVDHWDMLIAHPPCTYLSKAGAGHLFNKDHTIKDMERYEKMLKAKEFFMKMYDSNIPKICVENPIAFLAANLPKHTQTVHPWQYGHPYKKATRLWLKGLPELQPTEIAPEPEGGYQYWCPSNTSKSAKEKNMKRGAGVATSQKMRSKTFRGIANAMADQWG